MKKTQFIKPLKIGILSASLLVAYGVSAATAFKTIDSSPLKINVGEDNSFQVFNEDIGTTGQFYPNTADLGDAGWIVRVNGKSYAPDFKGHGKTHTSFLKSTPVTPVSLSEVSGSGTTLDPFTVTVKSELGDSGLSAEMLVRYITGQEYFTTWWTLSNNTAAAIDVNNFYAADIFLANTDKGITFHQTTGSQHIVGGKHCGSDYHILLIPQMDVTAYAATTYADLWMNINGGVLKGVLSGYDVCGGSIIDNAAGLQWNRTIPANGSISVGNVNSFGSIPAIAQFNVDTITPPTGKRGETVQVTITGNGFLADTTFDFGAGVTVTNVTINSTNEAIVELLVDPAAALGFRDVVAQQDANGFSTTKVDAFSVDKNRGVGSAGIGVGETTLITTGAALDDGNVYVWGFRGSAQQGNGKMVVASNVAPARVESLKNVVQLVGGAYHLIALDEKGDVYGWGQSGYGETGCTPTKSIYVETPCKVLENAVQIGAGEYFSIALDSDGQVWTWGHDLYGQLGNGVKGTKYNTKTPYAVDLKGETARLIGAAYEGAFAVTNEGHVWAWGDNEASGLGFQGTNYGVQSIVPTPTRVSNLDAYADKITFIAGGNGWGEALLDDGTVIGWGLHAALGQGTAKTNISSPEPVTVLENVKHLFARYVGSFAQTENGDLYTWGQTGGSAFKMVYGEAVTLRKNVKGNVVKLGGGKEHLFYQNDKGEVYGIGYNDLYKINQQKCCAPIIDWPGVQITLPASN